MTITAQQVAMWEREVSTLHVMLSERDAEIERLREERLRWRADNEHLTVDNDRLRAAKQCHRCIGCKQWLVDVNMAEHVAQCAEHPITKLQAALTEERAVALRRLEAFGEIDKLNAELLAALEEIADDPTGISLCQVEIAKAAIARAEGK